MMRNGNGKPRRVALYTQPPAEDPQPGLQLDELRRIVHQRGWIVVGEYVDVARRGNRDRRPELTRLLTDVRRGAIDVVVAASLSALAPSVGTVVAFVEDLRLRGVDLVAVRDVIDTTADSAHAYVWVQALAKLAHNLKREKARTSLEDARRRGVRVGRPRVVVDLDRARELQAEGWSIPRIARTLGIGVTTLRRALKNSADQPMVSSPPSAVGTRQPTDDLSGDHDAVITITSAA